MAEQTPNSTPEQVPSAAEIHSRLEQLGVDYLAYTKTPSTNPHMTELILGAPTGERIILHKVVPGTAEEDDFIQDMNVSIHPGTNRTAKFQQIDYNFGQFTPGELRKRVIGGSHFTDSKKEFVKRPKNRQQQLEAIQAGIRELHESQANIKLEEAVGATNQPATEAERAELVAILDSAVVLDPRKGYAPVNQAS